MGKWYNNINPLLDYLHSSNMGYTLPDGTKIAGMAFADDLFLISDNTPDITNNLDHTVTFLAHNTITINVRKTVFMSKDPNLSLSTMDTSTNKLKPITRLSCEDICVYLGVPFSITNTHALDDHLTKKFTKYCSAITRRYLPVDLKVLLLNTITIPAIEYPMHTHLLETKTLATLECTARSCLCSTLCIFGKYNSSIFKNKLTCLFIHNITTLQHGHFLNHYINRILNNDNSASHTHNILMNNYYPQPTTNPADHPLQLYNPGPLTRSKLKTITQLLCTAKQNQLLLLRPKDTPQCLLPYERKLPLPSDLTNKLAAWLFSPLFNKDANTISNVHLATFPEDFQLTKHEPLNTPHNNAPRLIATDGSFKDGVAAAAVVTATTRYSAPPLGCHTSFKAEASAIAYALEATVSIPSLPIIFNNKAMVNLFNEPPKHPPLKAVATWRIISQHLETHNISIAHVYSHQEKKTSKEWKEKITKQKLLHPDDYDQRVLLNREADKRVSLAQRTITACNLHPLQTLALLLKDITMIIQRPALGKTMISETSSKTNTQKPTNN